MENFIDDELEASSCDNEPNTAVDGDYETKSDDELHKYFVES